MSSTGAPRASCAYRIVTSPHGFHRHMRALATTSVASSTCGAAGQAGMGMGWGGWVVRGGVGVGGHRNQRALATTSVAPSTCAQGGLEGLGVGACVSEAGRGR